jgi:hypothetical protein
MSPRSKRLDKSHVSACNKVQDRYDFLLGDQKQVDFGVQAVRRSQLTSEPSLECTRKAV